MPLTLSLLESGLEVLDFTDTAAGYGVMEASLTGFGEPEIEATYGDNALRHGADLSHRRFENRVVEFRLRIKKNSATAIQDRETARNAVANVLDKARRYALRETLGTTVTAGEILLKYKKDGATSPVYARVLGGALGASPFEHSAAGALHGTEAIDFDIPVSLVLEPFWRPERDLYFRNCLLNGGMEAGFSSGVPYGWVASNDGAHTVSRASSTSFVRSGATSALQQITASTGAGASQLQQNVTLSNVGLSAGQTIAVSAQGFVFARTGGAAIRLRAIFRDAALVTLLDVQTADVTTTGSWQQLSLVSDIPTNCATVQVLLVVRTAASGETITSFWDEVQAQPHVYNLLLTGGFESDQDANGTADNWTFAKDASLTATATIDTSSVKYGTKSQRLESTAGTGAMEVNQSVTLASFGVRAGDTLTAAAWHLASGSGVFSSEVQIRFLDSSREISRSSSTALTANAAAFEYLSVSAAVPVGAVSATVRLITTVTSGTKIVRWDWATLYAGDHDGSGGRFWPHLAEWTDANRLTDNPVATDGKQITLRHSGFRGNVPAPCQVLIGLNDQSPQPLVVGYKRNDPTWRAYLDEPDSIAAGFATVADDGAIGGNVRRWTPPSTAITFLMSWVVSNQPPGRYLVAARVKTADVDNFRFLAAARLAATNANAGTWTKRTGKPPWAANNEFVVWPIGVLELPPVNRLPSYVNSFRVELWGRAVATGTTVDIDALWLVPVDGYTEAYRGPNSTVLLNQVTALVDSITPLPGTLLTDSAGGVAYTLPQFTSAFDRLVEHATPIFLGTEGRLLILHEAATWGGDSPINVGLYYRPQFTTPS